MSDITVEIVWAQANDVATGDPGMMISTRYQRGNRFENSDRFLPCEVMAQFKPRLSIWQLIEVAAGPAHEAQQRTQRAIAAANAKRARRASRRVAVPNLADVILSGDIDKVHSGG